MGEIKSVKVDNWGVFFLQKLQNFFNKTDYCDLTLQFRDNSQLKVHRLVLSACTDFFNVLEQTCELMDDALVMPLELQADVVVPIVNFMYTGTLEFELKMYNKLLKTAREMNMTVLLKLLEAHKRTMESSKPTTQRASSPKNRGRRPGVQPTLTKYVPSATPINTGQQQQQQRRMIPINPTTPVRRMLPGKPVPGSTIFRQIGNSIIKTSPKLQRGPTRYENVDSNMRSEAFESSFDNISYESKPLKEEPEEYEEMHSSPKNRSSPFEQLRKGYNNNKRPAVATFTSPPAKKPNIEDVKEFSEQQRMRKQIAAEYGDDAEYDGLMDDEFHNDDDDDEPAGGGPSSSSAAARQQQQNQGQASIIIKQSPNEKPTIVVKDTSNSKMDHAKIISEVLRQYPNLVKGSKNIKLKIMPNVAGQAQKVVVKKDSAEENTAGHEQIRVGVSQQARQQLQQITQNKQTLLKPVVGKPPVPLPSQRVQPTAPQPAATTSGVQQKRRIDSKTMHALIALGAENTTGPWLCLRCGINGRPISIPSYRGFRRHLIHTHKEVIDPSLCEHCGWRSSNDRVLYHHMLVEHNLSSPLYVFPKCSHCSKYFFNDNELQQHIHQNHADRQSCIYCNQTFAKEMQLYNHMKAYHKTLARDDGIIDFSDEDIADFDDEVKQPEPQSAKKIKIISDISLPTTILKLDEIPAPIDEEYTGDTGPKFVNADGNEMVLTAEQREEIMSQLEQDHDGGVVMVLNETAFPQGAGDTEEEGDADGEGDGEGDAETETEPEGTDEVTKADPTTENIDQYDDHQIYNEFPSEDGSSCDKNIAPPRRNTTDHKVEEKKAREQEVDHEEQMDDVHMEWAENVISAHDPDDEEEEEHDDEDHVNEDDNKTQPKPDTSKESEDKVSSTKTKPDIENEDKNDSKKDDDISLKLKMLTGDWSDDEIEDEDELGNLGQNEKDTPVQKEPPTSDSPGKSIPESSSKKQSPSAKDDIHPDEETEDHDDEKAILRTDPIDEEASQSNDMSKIEKELFEDDKASLDDDPNKSEESVSETLSAIEAEIRGKSPSPIPEKKSTSRRSSSAKDTIDEPARKKSSTKSIDEDILSDIVSSSKKSEDDPIADADPDTNEDSKPDDDDKKSTDYKTDKEEVVTSTKPEDDSLKTVEKVKSLMSEWADDDDEL